MASPASYAFLKAQVFTAPGLGDVAVGMPNERTVKVQHRAPGGAWSTPTVLFKKKGITCGMIDGRASAGGVALMVECDTPYYEDQAPVHSRALVTQDLVHWTGMQLGGEAYQDPAISADGSHAAWLFGGHGEYELFSEGSGFTTGHTSFDYDSGGETVVVDDAGTVTVMGPDGNGHGCELGVWDKPLVGPEAHYVIPGVNPGCTEGGVDNVDDRTVVGGVDNRSERFVVTREPGQRWELTTGPPADAPSLVSYRGPRKQVIRNVFSDATGQQLVSLGGPDRHHVYAQAYDDATATWGTPALVATESPGRCSVPGAYYDDPPPRMHLVRLRCTSGIALLTSPDSTTWTRTVLDHRPYAISTERLAARGAGPDGDHRGLALGDGEPPGHRHGPLRLRLPDRTGRPAAAARGNPRQVADAGPDVHGRQPLADHLDGADAEDRLVPADHGSAVRPADAVLPARRRALPVGQGQARRAGRLARRAVHLLDASNPPIARGSLTPARSRVVRSPSAPSPWAPRCSRTWRGSSSRRPRGS